MYRIKPNYREQKSEKSEREKQREPRLSDKAVAVMTRG